MGEGSSITVKIKLSAGPVRSVTIPVMKMEQGGATFATYSGVPISVALASGETENSITFSATADGANDDGESVKLTFGTLPAGVNPRSTAETVKSITDDDVPAVTVSFEQAAYTVAESDDPATAEIRENRATVKVKPSHDPEWTVTIVITKAGRGGETAADYSGIPENVTFDAWDTEKTFDFSATADSVDDDGESVKLDFGTMPTGVFASGTTETTVSIIDYDLPSVTVTFEEWSYTVPGGSTMTVKVQLSQDPERPVTIPITKADQGGATAADYSGVPEDLTFDAGDTEKSITFGATMDSIDDGEPVKLGFGTLPMGVPPGTNDETTVSITDDDLPAVAVRFEKATYTVVESDDPSTIDEQENQVAIKVKLSTDPERSVTIPITRVD